MLKGGIKYLRKTTEVTIIFRMVGHQSLLNYAFYYLAALILVLDFFVPTQL